MVIFLPGHFKACSAASRYINLQFGCFQQPALHQRIHLIVIHDENTRFRRFKALMVLCHILPSPGDKLHTSDWRTIHDFLCQYYGKYRAFSVNTVHRYFTAHQIHQLLCNGKSQSASLHPQIFLPVCPHKGIIQMLQVLFPDSNAGIRYRNLEMDGIPVYRLPMCRKCDGTCICILCRIGEKIQQHLADPLTVPQKDRRQFFINIHLELQIFLLHTHLHHIHKIMKQIHRFVFQRHNLHLFHFHLRQIQNVIDEIQQHLAGILNIPGIFHGFLFSALPENHFIQADNRIDGCTQFMTHTGKKAVFGIADTLQFFFLVQGNRTFNTEYPHLNL